MVKIDHLRKLDPATNIFFRVHENKFLKNLKDSWVVFIHENHLPQKFSIKVQQDCSSKLLRSFYTCATSGCVGQERIDNDLRETTTKKEK